MIWLLLADVLLINDGARLTNARVVALRVLPEREGWEIALGPALDAPQAWRPLGADLTYELSEGDGEKTIYAWLRDPAGRQSGPLRASIVLDTLPPRAKATAPARARPGKIVVVSNVPDAVAMQFGDGSWRPYASPTEVELPPGLPLVRYRDAAGNVSEPLLLVVELAEDAPRIEAANEVRSVRVAPVAGRRGVLLSIEASGMREMQLRIDDGEPLPREAFAARRVVELEPGSRRIRIRLWDQMDDEHAAESAFQEEELARLEPERDPDHRAWFATIRGGAIFNTLGFDAVTTIGPRELKAGTLGVARVEVGVLLSDSIFASAAFEAGQGEEVDVLTAELALGYRWPAGEGFELHGQLGVVAATMDVETSDFGEFDPGIGFRAAAGAQLRLSDALWAGLTLEYRDVALEWSDDLVSGDDAARLRGAGLTAGLVLRF